MSEKKNKGGRPSKLPNIDLNQVEILSSLGLSDAQMANFFGVTRATWHNWKKKSDKFFDTIKKGKAGAKELLKASFFHLACGYSHPEEKIFYDATRGEAVKVETTKHYPPNAACLIFGMKNLFGWKNEPVNEDKEEAFIDLMKKFSQIMKGGE